MKVLDYEYKKVKCTYCDNEIEFIEPWVDDEMGEVKCKNCILSHLDKAISDLREKYRCSG